MQPARPALHSRNRRGDVATPRIETEGETNTLRFQCPNTGREFNSSIATRCGARLISIRARCPICEDLHEWHADGSLGPVLSSDHQSNDTRLTKALTVLQDFHGSSTKIIELREQLFDEFHHRLKNNLQMLYGLLQIAWSKTDSAEAREGLS